MYENKREEFNTGLKLIGDQYYCILVHCPRLQEDNIIDGIHPSVQSSVPKLVSSYKYVLNKMLGLSDVHVDNRNIQTSNTCRERHIPKIIVYQEDITRGKTREMISIQNTITIKTVTMCFQTKKDGTII